MARVAVSSRPPAAASYLRFGSQECEQSAPSTKSAARPMSTPCAFASNRRSSAATSSGAPSASQAIVVACARRSAPRPFSSSTGAWYSVLTRFIVASSAATHAARKARAAESFVAPVSQARVGFSARTTSPNVNARAATRCRPRAGECAMRRAARCSSDARPFHSSGPATAALWKSAIIGEDWCTLERHHRPVGQPCLRQLRKPSYIEPVLHQLALRVYAWRPSSPRDPPRCRRRVREVSSAP